MEGSRCLDGGGRTVLFLEEKGLLAENVIECLSNHNYRCRYLENGKHELSQDDFTGVDAVLMGMDGGNDSTMELLRKVQNLSGGVPVVVLSSIGRPPSMNEVREAGAFGMVNKPFRSQELLDILDSCMILGV